MTYPLDPEIASSYAAVPILSAHDLADLQGLREKQRALLAQAPEPDTTGVRVEDVRIGEVPVPVRVYRPVGAAAPLPAIVTAHSGGYVCGNVEAVHDANVGLCRDTGGLVASVDYRLAPEAPFPAGLEDCFTALCWVAEHAGELGVDPGRIAVHGVSAGAGLVAALALLARDRGGPPIRFQYLAAPQLDDRQQTQSHRRFTDTPFWDTERSTFTWRLYLGCDVAGTDAVPEYAAPARARDLSGLPPAYVAVNEFDPLRDEGLAYALGLLAVGVSVELHLFPGTLHGSATVLRAADVSRRENQEQVRVLRTALAPAPPR